MRGANIVYHNVHHQSWGLKVRTPPIQHTLHCYLSEQSKYGTDKLLSPTEHNFQIYFTWWDQLLNTVYEGKRTLHTPPSPAEVRAWPVKRRLEFFRQLELDELRKANIPATRLKSAIRVTQEERSITNLKWLGIET